ncbi:MAG: LysE family translocator [Proteobacteria bacterium]|nr:LysE family translocator [Pseudomonadota bacterium]
MELSALGLFAVALFVAAGSPGPSIAALVARVITKGLGSVLPFLLALWIGEVLWLVAAVTGLGVVAEKFHYVFLTIKYLGIAYLVWLAWKMWHAPVALNADEMPQSESPWKLFATGMALTLGNPKIMVFYLALLPSLIDVRHVSTVGLLELVLVAFSVVMIVDLSWAYAASWARRWLKSPWAVRLANRSSAVAMGGAAAALATK